MGVRTPAVWFRQQAIDLDHRGARIVRGTHDVRSARTTHQGLYDKGSLWALAQRHCKDTTLGCVQQRVNL
jgi:hypothetical protein